MLANREFSHFLFIIITIISYCEMQQIILINHDAFDTMILPYTINVCVCVFLSFVYANKFTQFPLMTENTVKPLFASRKCQDIVSQLKEWHDSELFKKKGVWTLYYCVSMYDVRAYPLASGFFPVCKKICCGPTTEGSHQQCHYIDSVIENYLWQTFQNDVHLMWINWDSSQNPRPFLTEYPEMIKWKHWIQKRPNARCKWRNAKVSMSCHCSE